VRSLDLAVQLQCDAPNLGVPDREVLNMSMELRLEFATITLVNLPDADWKLFDDVADARHASGYGQVIFTRKPRLLSNNGSSYWTCRGLMPLL